MIQSEDLGYFQKKILKLYRTKTNKKGHLKILIFVVQCMQAC